MPLRVLALLLVLSGCANVFAPMEREMPVVAPVTDEAARFTELPQPQEPIVVAVYRFRDQTGQYKPSQTGAGFSTAVTQGGTSILMRALESSGWFTPIERENLSNLLNERQIISTMRAQHSGGEGAPSLPPLLFAGVLLEGGIVGYDTNLLTSGGGLRYFGVGGSGQYRKDQVTVYLRAVSTQTGEVFTTVHTTKTIVSQELSSSLFRYVDTQRLLEAEIGYTANEPGVVAVTEAIEAAVRALVLEGLRDGLWSSASPVETAEALTAYDREVSAREGYSAFGTPRLDPARRTALTLQGGSVRYRGDYRDPLDRPVATAGLLVPVSPRFAIGVNGGFGQLAAEGAFEVSFLSSEVLGRLAFLPRSRFTPYVQAGGGALIYVEQTGFPRTFFPYVSGGGGVSYRLTPRFSLFAGAQQVYPLYEGLDGFENGTVNDNAVTIQSGIAVSF
jgi:curli production assembly/transport component CsgG